MNNGKAERQHNPQSMQQLILWRVFPAATLILLLIVGLCQFAAKRSIEHEVDRRVEQAAAFSAARLRKQLDLLRNYANGLASNDLTINSIVDSESREGQLTLFLRSLRLPSPAFRRATMVDYRGRPVVSNRIGGHIDATQFLTPVMAGEHYFHIDQERIIAASPVIYGGKPEAVLAVEYDTSVFLKELQSLGTGHRLQLLSRGKPIYDSEAPEESMSDWVTARHAVIESALPENRVDPNEAASDSPLRADSLATISHDNVYANLEILRSESYASAFEPLWFVNLFFAGVFLASIITILAGTFASAKFSTQPLRSVIEDISEIETSGALSRRLQETGPSEFLKLSQSFNQLLDSVSQTTVSLDKLTESETRLRTVIETVPHGILASDSEGRITLVNRQLEQLSGYSRNELIGLPISKLIPNWDDDEGERGSIAEPVSDHSLESPSRMEMNGRKKTGEVMPLEIHISSTATSAGAERLASLADVSARKKRERENELLRHQTQLILDSIPAMVIFKDVENRIIRVNQAVASLVGSTPDEIQGRHSSEFFKEHEKYHQDDLDVIQSGGPRLGIVESITTENGSIRWASTDKIPVKGTGGDTDGIIAVINDITKLKAAENALRDSNEKLLRSNEDLAQFAYVASHDLQEPLRKITSFCALLQEDYSDSIDDDGKQFMHYIVNGADRMRTLIQDLLTFSRIESSKSAPTATDLNQCLQTVVEQFEEMIEENQAVITFDTLATVQAHRSQMVRLLQNLIGNSIKYRGTAAPIIHVRGQDKTNGSTFSVRDNGIGIAPQYQDQIFGIFKRLHSSDEYPGTGIGLAICKRIVEHQGGRIWLDSEPGKGTTVYVSL